MLACWNAPAASDGRLNTVKRYARAATAEQLQRPPRYGRTLVDPYRNHLRRRLATEPGVAVTHLLEEIRELGYTGSANLLVRYLNQGRADAERTSPSPRRLVSWIITRPADLPEHERGHLDELLAACPHLTVLAEQVRAFAELLICGHCVNGPRVADVDEDLSLFEGSHDGVSLGMSNNIQIESVFVSRRNARKHKPGSGQLSVVVSREFPTSFDVCVQVGQFLAENGCV